MNNQINLIPKTDQTVTSTLERFTTLRYVAIISMSLVLFCAVMLFLAINFSSLPFLSNEENKLLLTMSQYDTTVAKLSLYSGRMNQAQKLIANRLPYDTNIAVVTAVLPPDVAIQSYELKEKKVDITVASSSLLSLNTFIMNLQTLAVNKKTKQIIMGSLTKSSSDNTYTLSITLSLI